MELSKVVYGSLWENNLSENSLDVTPVNITTNENTAEDVRPGDTTGNRPLITSEERRKNTEKENERNTNAGSLQEDSLLEYHMKSLSFNITKNEI